MKANKAILVLADHTTYYGWSFSKLFTSKGEIVFNTGITGYQEIMTDPSYSQQIVAFTYPELGNTGINHEDNEAQAPCLNGIIAKNICLRPSNWRTCQSLIEYLEKYNISHIYGVDTRSLTKHLRKFGTMNGCISTHILDPQLLIQEFHNDTNYTEKDLVQFISTTHTYKLQKIDEYKPIYKPQIKNQTQYDLKIIVIDFGVKLNILRNLLIYTKEIIIIPATSSSQEILKYKPDGILLSNGPGDPQKVTYAIKTVQQLLAHKIPTFGICMGHQILSIALGMPSFKLKFGHRGLNHPIGTKNTIEISSQNHGFAINNHSSHSKDIFISQVNYNDYTIAGISHRKYPLFAVQYHPEASPGPQDSHKLFAHFINIIRINKKYPNFISKSIYFNHTG
uniref:Carbamoyl phosphate synthase small chain n=1 Tax=Dichotomaria marginata TaxID=268567 RepID=A0A1G4NS29_9FLOR|nr:Carbamoyl phosphate synthase small subunit [Dichotomaria marginata]SCW21468.1 Carbamoyl phosphate synthase small subunit [Dichotomaria marginata]